MKDALGSVQSVGVLGGTSEIAVAVCRALAGAGRLEHVVLAGRDIDALRATADRMIAWGVSDVQVMPFDAGSTSEHGAVVDALFAGGDLDVVLLAFGTLGGGGLLDSPLEAVRIAQVNYVGAVSTGLRIAAELRRQGHGTLVVLSSVAAERGRASNFVYGSSKAGLDTFAQGLGDRLRGSGVRVLVVRPGFVRTRMSAGLPEPPFACTADDVGRAVAKALRTGQETVWVPAVLRVVMSGLRHTPRWLFRRLPL